jgi:hypothetical protein
MGVLRRTDNFEYYVRPLLRPSAKDNLTKRGRSTSLSKLARANMCVCVCVCVDKMGAAFNGR